MICGGLVPVTTRMHGLTTVFPLIDVVSEAVRTMYTGSPNDMSKYSILCVVPLVGADVCEDPEWVHVVSLGTAMQYCPALYVQGHCTHTSQELPEVALTCT